MLIHPNFDPIALQLGPIAIRWYGLMYLTAFALVIFLGRMRIRTQPWLSISSRDLDDMLFYGVLGVVLGGRLGYILFYKPLEYLHDPIRIFFVWEGGIAPPWEDRPGKRSRVCFVQVELRDRDFMPGELGGTRTRRHRTTIENGDLIRRTRLRVRARRVLAHVAEVTTAER